MGQSKQVPVCQECGARGPKGTKKAHDTGWLRNTDHTWLCPTHAEEVRQRYREAEAQRRAQREAKRRKDEAAGKKAPLGLLLSLAMLGSPRRHF